MSQQTLVGAATTAAFTYNNDSGPCEWVVYQCQGLGAAETITINTVVNGTAIPLYGVNGDGTTWAVTFTGSGGTPANRTSLYLVGGPVYQFVSAGTAGAVSITYCPGKGINA